MAHSGINLDPMVKKNIFFVVLSMLTYLFIQVVISSRSSPGHYLPSGEGQ